MTVSNLSHSYLRLFIIGGKMFNNAAGAASNHFQYCMSWFVVGNSLHSLRHIPVLMKSIFMKSCLMQSIFDWSFLYVLGAMCAEVEVDDFLLKIGGKTPVEMFEKPIEDLTDANLVLDGLPRPIDMTFARRPRVVGALQ